MRLGLAILIAATSGALARPACADFGEASSSDRKAIAASGLPQASVVAVKSGMVVAVRNRGAISTAGAVVEGITLQGEVVSNEAAQFLGYRSMRSTVNVDCLRRRDLVVKMTVYSERGAKGAAVVRQVPGGWTQPSPDAYLAAVIRSVCGGAPRQIAAAPSLPAKDAAEISADHPVRSVARPISRPAPLDPLPPPSMPEVVGPDQPMRTSVEARYRAPSAQMVSNAAPPELRPAIQPPSSSKPAEPAPAKPAAKPTPKPAQKLAPKAAPGKLSVQIAASSSEAQALAALAKIKGKVAPPLSMQVKRVVVDGKTFHRALITGFGARSDAQAFCSALKGDCFVR